MPSTAMSTDNQGCLPCSIPQWRPPNSAHHWHLSSSLSPVRGEPTPSNPFSKNRTSHTPSPVRRRRMSHLHREWLSEFTTSRLPALTIEKGMNTTFSPCSASHSHFASDAQICHQLHAHILWHGNSNTGIGLFVDTLQLLQHAWVPKRKEASKTRKQKN